MYYHIYGLQSLANGWAADDVLTWPFEYSNTSTLSTSRLHAWYSIPLCKMIGQSAEFFRMKDESKRLLINTCASNKQGLKEVRSTETGWVSDSKRRQISPFPAFRSFTVIRIETDEHGRCICMRDQRNDGCAERTSLPLSLSYCVQLLLVDVSDSLDLKDWPTCP
jgi:hypothetical protein